MEHIAERRGEELVSEIDDFNSSNFANTVKTSYKKAQESVAEKLDETVWTTASVNYRSGPGTTYDRIGTLNMYSGVKRVATTFNEWSQILVGEDIYYVLSEFLTTEAPLITEGGAKGEYQRYALSQLSNYGWDESEIVPLIKLWNRESNWNPNAHNRSSGAHGIPQSLPASKMASEGADYYTNAETQIRWGLGYIRNRYGSPSRAWAHSQATGWY